MSTYVTSNHKNIFQTINTQLLVGIGWKILSCACFAGVNIIVRYLAGNKIKLEQSLPILVIIFFQNIISTIFLIPFVFKKSIPIKCFLATKNLNLQLLRIVLTTLGMLLWYNSLIKMPVTQVIAISFISPILTLIGAIVLLKEKLNFKKLIAIILSITGGILISKTNLISYNIFSNLNALLPISAGLIFSLDKLITRKILTRKECPKLTTLYILGFTAPLCFILTLITNSWVCPNYSNFFMLLLLGTLGTVANFAFTKSLATAEITSIMPYGITKLIFSAILSYIFFDEILETFNIWLGAIIISISTILLL